jgi:hypothetical protein
MNTNENATTPTRKHKRYDEAFQRSTVEHWMLSDKSTRQTAASGESCGFTPFFSI